MVRAGKVEHPERWRWCGYDELTGQRKRYRIINQDRLLRLTGCPSMSEFAEVHSRGIAEWVSMRNLQREAYWTEAVAVGDSDFVNTACQTTAYRQHMECYKVEDSAGQKTWAVREDREAYRGDSVDKTGV